MDKVLYTNFTTTEELVDELLKQKEFKKAMTRTNLAKFWKSVAGEKFAQKSRPWGMLGSNTMIIACENAIVAQELLLNKSKLLEKFTPYTKSLKIKVEDLRFDAKKWNERNL